MFDFVANRKRIVQIVIALIMLPFAFFGIDFYSRGVDKSDQVAVVGGAGITSSEFGRALRERQEQVRQMMQGKASSEILNSPEIKNQVVEQLIEERLMLASADKTRLGVSDSRLRDMIQRIPAFKNDVTGKFSKERYELLLQTRGIDPSTFEAGLRSDAVISQVRGSVASTGFLPRTIAGRLAKIRGQQREVSQVIVSPMSFLAQVKLADDEAKQYYDNTPTAYTLPERARVEYVVLSLEAMQKQVSVKEEDIRKYYQENALQFEQPEERRARHILFAVDAKASEEVRSKAKSQAAALLATARKEGVDFAELAKKNSQDPGSAPEGGDLGFFAKGRMAKPFDEAVFAMKAGEIVGPVETQYGYHMIRLEEIKAGKRQALEEVRANIEEEVKKNAANREFAEKAEQLSTLVYEQSDSLKTASETLKLAIDQSGWVTRDRAEIPVLNNEKLLKAIFSEEAVKNKRNTEAVEVAPSTIVSARIVEHIPPARQPYEVVKEIIVEQLKAKKAAELARKDGEEKLARLKKGESISLPWSPAQAISREKTQGLSPEAAQVVFQADASKLPAYAGFGGGDGRYVLFRVSNVTDSAETNEEADQALAKQVASMLAREAQAARVQSLRTKSKVKINKDRFEKG
ncbi:MAG: peptidylprolyl isomerase [Betaproteobacteria bacterium]|nr:peptidylprolyl isomerase [Betaproteobacteria bacterium]